MFKTESFNLGCHGIQNRCLSFRGKIMPFCSRCLGCSIGHIFSFALFLLGDLPNFYLAILLIIPMAIDWSVQEFLGVMSNNSRRLITGLLGGFGVGIIIWKFIDLLIIRFI